MSTRGRQPAISRIGDQPADASEGPAFSVHERILVLSGGIGRDSVRELYSSIERYDRGTIGELDLSSITGLDGAGVGLIDWIITRFDCDVVATNDVVVAAREQYSGGARLVPDPEEEDNIFAIAGAAVIENTRKSIEYLQLAADVAHWVIPGIFGTVHQRRGSFATQCVRIGVESTGIVVVLSFIIGLILALQSAVQLVQFGAGIFVADLLAVSVIREMGPMMTAIIVAGRSGSSIASEIATMQVSEELDALEVLGINPVRYTVVPRILAGITVLPLLTVISIVAAVGGGALVSSAYLRMSLAIFLSQSAASVGVDDLVIALIKSVVFGSQIVLIAGYYGLHASGGAEGVGKVTTSSVVASIFAVIVIDVIFSMLYIV